MKTINNSILCSIVGLSIMTSGMIFLTGCDQATDTGTKWEITKDGKPIDGDKWGHDFVCPSCPPYHPSAHKRDTNEIQTVAVVKGNMQTSTKPNENK